MSGSPESAAVTRLKSMFDIPTNRMRTDCNSPSMIYHYGTIDVRSNDRIGSIDGPEEIRIMVWTGATYCRCQ
jgi:hypothetical protein